MHTGPAILTECPMNCPECGDNDASKHFSKQTGLQMNPMAVSQMNVSRRKHEGYLQYGAVVPCRKLEGDFESARVIRTERERSHEK